MLLAVHYRVMEHLGSLESTQEARVALGYASGNSYASFVLSKLPACSITRLLIRHNYQLQTSLQLLKSFVFLYVSGIQCLTIKALNADLFY